MLKFDVPTIFSLAGGPAALRRALAEDNEGLAPSKAVVGMWKTRNSIAPLWLPACLYAVLSRDPERAALDLIVREDLGDPFS